MKILGTNDKLALIGTFTCLILIICTHNSLFLIPEMLFVFVADGE